MAAAMNTTDRDWPDPVQGFSPAGQLLPLITGYRTSRAISVAAELGLAKPLGNPARRGTSALPQRIGVPWRSLAMCGAHG
jgi:hypothetical protein